MRTSNMCIAVWLAMSASSAPAMTGNELLAALNDNPGSSEETLARGYIQGIAEALDTRLFGVTNTRTACFDLPASITNGQIIDIVRNSLMGSPEHRHQPAHVYVTATLSGIWPCDTSKPRPQQQSEQSPA